MWASSNFEAEIGTIAWALQLSKAWEMQLGNIFTNVAKAVYAVNGRINQCNWKIQQSVKKIQEINNYRENLGLEVILREWNWIADKLADMGCAKMELSLFLQGRYLPNWLMMVIHNSKFWF